MSPIPKTLDSTYRARAIPLGSVRYWSWLFASAAARPPLLGIYALLAEWQALTDPGTEASAGRMKLAWWQEEIHRLIAGTPVHPIGVYLASLPRAGEVDFGPLAVAVDASVAECSGVPLERGADLEPHASALRALPLEVASRLTARGRRCRRLAELPAGTGGGATTWHARLATTGAKRASDACCLRWTNCWRRASTTPICAPIRRRKTSRSYLQQLRARAARSYETAALALPSELPFAAASLAGFGRAGAQALAAPHGNALSPRACRICCSLGSRRGAPKDKR